MSTIIQTNVAEVGQAMQSQLQENKRRTSGRFEVSEGAMPVPPAEQTFDVVLTYDDPE